MILNKCSKNISCDDIFKKKVPTYHTLADDFQNPSEN